MISTQLTRKKTLGNSGILAKIVHLPRSAGGRYCLSPKRSLPHSLASHASRFALKKSRFQTPQNTQKYPPPENACLTRPTMLYCEGSC